MLIAAIGMAIFTGLLVSLAFYTGTDEDSLEAVAIGAAFSLLTSAAMGK